MGDFQIMGDFWIIVDFDILGDFWWINFIIR